MKYLNVSGFYIKVIIAYFFCFILCFRPSYADGCLEYYSGINKNEITVIGYIIQEPSVSTIGVGNDLPIDKFISLSLLKSICVHATDGDDNEADEDEDDVKEIQLVYRDSLGYSRESQFLGKKVRVTGKLFHKDNANQRTDILILVSKINIVN